MKFCFVTPTYLEPLQAISSGVITAIRALALKLIEEGHRVWVVTFSKTASSVANIEGVEVHYTTPDQVHWYVSKLPLIGTWFALPFREVANSWRLMRSAMQLHRLHRFDVIEGTETNSVFLSLRPNLPLVIRLHGEEFTFHKYTPNTRLKLALHLTRYIQRIALQRAQVIISPSTAHANEIIGELGMPQSCKRLHVTPHVVHLPRASQPKFRPDPIIIFAGRIQQIHKGFLDALTCLAQVLKTVPHARLIVIGGYHPTLPKDMIDQTIMRLGIRDAVHFQGSLPPEAVTSWYQSARILLMPSFYETFGLVAIEAMSHGLPIVGYASGSLPEVVEEGGILVAPADVQALAEVTLQLLQDDSLWQHMSICALQRVQRYPNDEYFKRNMELYCQLVGVEA